MHFHFQDLRAFCELVFTKSYVPDFPPACFPGVDKAPLCISFCEPKTALKIVLK